MKFKFSVKSLLWWVFIIAIIYFSSIGYSRLPSNIKSIAGTWMEWFVLLLLIYWFITSVFFGENVIKVTEEVEKKE